MAQHGQVVVLGSECAIKAANDERGNFLLRVNGRARLPLVQVAAIRLTAYATPCAFEQALFTSFIWSTMRRNLLCCRPGAFVKWMAWYNRSRSHRDLPMADFEFMRALSTTHPPLLPGDIALPGKRR